MQDYNFSQLEYRDKCKSRIKLQLQVAGADVSDEKVEDMLESTNPCVFTDAVGLLCCYFDRFTMARCWNKLLQQRNLSWK